MSCELYEKHELGLVEKAVFDDHVKTCEECSRAAAQDQRLMNEAGQLGAQIDSPMLWGKIENTLREEIQREERFAQTAQFKKWHSRPIFRMAMAAVLLVAVSAGIFFVQKETQAPQPSARLLTESALEQVRQTEKAYEEAIAQLETTANKKILEMDIELALLYRDKLETIDAQIERCREALAENPGNAHIRRYMMAALQDKRTTLEGLLKNPESAL